MAKAKGRVALPVCRFEGDVITTCPGCRGEGRHVRQCLHDAHDRCVRDAPDKVVPGEIDNCATCPDHRPAAPPSPKDLAAEARAMMRRAAATALPADLVAAVERTQRLTGWCPREKAFQLAEWVVKNRPAVCVEVGVWAGRSLLPVALALKHLGRGVVHAVDPWTVEAISEGGLPPEASAEQLAIDAPARRAEFEAAVKYEGVGGFVRVHPVTSERAAGEIAAPIDLLHIDGNHTPDCVARDVRLWLPKVRVGGLVVIDDVDLPGVRAALPAVEAVATLHANHDVASPPWRAYRVEPQPRRLLVPEPPPLDLRPTKPTAVVTVVVGDECREIHAAGAAHLRAYAERVGADLVILDWGGHPEWPISAKFAVARVLDHYERIAYVDADTLLRPRAVNLFEHCAPHEFGFVDELAWQRAIPGFRREAEYQRFRALMGMKVVPLPWYMNTGVLVVPRSHRHILMPPTEPIPVAHCSEQDWIGARLLDSGLPYRLMDRRCNWQSWTSSKDFADAPEDAILHWSGTGPTRAGRAKLIREWAARHPLSG